MNADPIAALALFFGLERTRQGLLARQALERPGEDDVSLAAQLRGELAAGVRDDGTVGGAVVPTIWRVHELLDLGAQAHSPAITRAVGWMLALQDRPGTFHEGCDKIRHARQLCQHYVAGFFAPGPPTERIAPVTLPTGKVFRVEPAARFAISCLALRAAIRAGLGDRPSIRRHVQSLVRISAQWTAWNDYFSPDTIIAGLHALAVAGPEHRSVVDRLVGVVTSHQGVEGEWPAADLFQVLDALLAAGTLEAQIAVRRAATMLASRQRADGTFGTMAQQERALIGLRALLWASRSPA